MRQCGHTTKLYQTGKTPKTAKGARRAAAAADGSVRQAAASAAADDADGAIRPWPRLDFVAQSRLLCGAKLGGFDGCLSSVADAPP